MSTTQRLLGHGKAISCCLKRMKIRTWVSWKNQTLVKKTGSVYTSPTNKQKIKEANSCRWPKRRWVVDIIGKKRKVLNCAYHVLFLIDLPVKALAIYFHFGHVIYFYQPWQFSEVLT
jgi:hypothetical protein